MGACHLLPFPGATQRAWALPVSGAIPARRSEREWGWLIGMQIGAEGPRPTTPRPPSTLGQYFVYPVASAAAQRRGRSRTGRSNAPHAPPMTLPLRCLADGGAGIQTSRLAEPQLAMSASGHIRPPSPSPQGNATHPKVLSVLGKSLTFR